MVKSRDTIINELKKHVSNEGFLNVLADMIREDSFYKVTPSGHIEINESDSILYSEIGYLIGLSIANNRSIHKLTKQLDNKAIEFEKNKIRKLLNQLHFSYSCNITEEDDLLSSNSIIESTFYAESGAFDIQYLKHIPKIYRYDLDWISKKVDFDISFCEEIFKAIIFRSEQTYEIILNDKNIPNELDLADKNNSINLVCTSPAEIFLYCKLLNKDSTILPKDVVAFFDTFSYVGQNQYSNFRGIESQNIVSEYPIIKIDDTRYFISSPILLSKAIYSRFYFVGIQDKKRCDLFSKHIGGALEETTKEYLESCFGNDNTFIGVKIESKRGNSISDADVLCFCDDAAVIAQCKNKRLTVQSRKGDMDAAATDFKKAIQDPYDQGCKLADAIKNGETLRFVSHDGKLIHVKKRITKVYIICITSDYYQGSKFQEILFAKRNNDFCLTQMSIFDLELAVKYLFDPYDFIYFLHRRLAAGTKIVTDNEINYLGYYLETDLAIPNKTDNLLIANDFGNIFYEDMVNESRFGKKTNYFINNRRLPDDFINLIQKIELINCDFSKLDISFFLRSISRDAAEDVLRLLNDSRKNNPTFDFSMTLCDADEYIGGLTIVTGQNKDRIIEAVVKLGNKHSIEQPHGDWLSVGYYNGNIIGVFFYKDDEDV